MEELLSKKMLEYISYIRKNVIALIIACFLFMSCIILSLWFSEGGKPIPVIGDVKFSKIYFSNCNLKTFIGQSGDIRYYSWPSKCECREDISALEIKGDDCFPK